MDSDVSNLAVYVVKFDVLHWPDIPEFITRSVELWNRWIRLACYYNRV